MTARHYGSSEESRGLGSHRKRENWEGDWLRARKRKSVRRKRGRLKDEKMKARGRKGTRETVAGEILYTCHSLPGSTIPVVEKC